MAGRSGKITGENEMPPAEPGKQLTVHRAVYGSCACCIPVCPEGARERIAAYPAAVAGCTPCGTCAKVSPPDAREVADETGI